MSVTREQLASLNVGDIIETTRTVKVNAKSLTGLSVYVEDVQSGQRTYFDTSPELNGSLRINMVKKAKRVLKAGYMITGREVRETSWKRGTILNHDPDFRPGTSGWVLAADGNWYSLAFPGEFYSFAAFKDYRNYVIKHIG